METPRSDFDIAIVGSGFGGSLLAMIARRLGYSVVLLEKHKHPRFAIGESSTPLANLLLQELSSKYDLPGVLPLTKWGSWQRTYPEIGCGLKRGFTFYHHVAGRPFTADATRRDQLLVAASPHDEISDTHWYRPDFDRFLALEASREGAEFIDEVSLDAPGFQGDVVVLDGNRLGKRLRVRAGFLIDASGPRGYLHRALRLSELSFDNLATTQGLYTHFTGVRGVEDLPPYASNEAPPYPPDRAALHHVFDGGWIWVLPFNNGITSAGVAASSSLAGKLGFEEGESGWNRLLETLPTVAEQFSEATPVLPFVHARKLPFRSGTVVGDRWGMVASASGFVDPLLSTGFPLTLFSILRLAEIMSAGWKSADLAARLDTYASETTEDLLAAERLVAALYANMHDFTLFTSLSLLYFAAASYAETAGRLGKPELARSFLLRDHPVFGPQSRACLQQAMRPLAPDQKSELMKRIEQTIEPVNVAGLNNPGRRNWYPVAAGDLFDSAHKVNATRDEIEELLDRCGFFPGTATA